jgi:hypothetical protein
MPEMGSMTEKSVQAGFISAQSTGIEHREEAGNEFSV